MSARGIQEAMELMAGARVALQEIADDWRTVLAEAGADVPEQDAEVIRGAVALLDELTTGLDGMGRRLQAEVLSAGNQPIDRATSA